MVIIQNLLPNVYLNHGFLSANPNTFPKAHIELIKRIKIIAANKNVGLKLINIILLFLFISTINITFITSLTHLIGNQCNTICYFIDIFINPVKHCLVFSLLRKGHCLELVYVLLQTLDRLLLVAVLESCLELFDQHFYITDLLLELEAEFIQILLAYFFVFALLWF